MAFGKLVDAGIVVVADPVTVLVVGATMIVVGNQEYDESVMVAVGSRLVPMLSDDVVAVTTELDSVGESVGGRVELGVAVGVSVSVILGSNVTVLDRVLDDDPLPVGRGPPVAVGAPVVLGVISTDVLFSDTVGLGRDVGRAVSVEFGVTVGSSVETGLMESVGEPVVPLPLAVTDPELATVGAVDAPVPEPVNPPDMVGRIPLTKLERALGDELSVGVAPEDGSMELRSELRRAVPLGVKDAEGPVEGPVKPDVIDGLPEEEG